MLKPPMSDTQAGKEAYLKRQQREQRTREAAPALLAALQNLVAECDKSIRYGSPIARDANEAMRAARAVISRVTGEAP
jgi:hypothetical protein